MKIEKEKPVSFASADPIRDLLRAIVEHTPRRHLNRKLSIQAVMNGLVLLLGSMDEKERLATLDRSLALLADAELDKIDVSAMEGRVMPQPQVGKKPKSS